MALRYVYELLYARGIIKSDVQLNIRAKEAQRALIDTAAEILHKSRICAFTNAGKNPFLAVASHYLGNDHKDMPCFTESKGPDDI